MWWDHKGLSMSWTLQIHFFCPNGSILNIWAGKELICSWKWSFVPWVNGTFRFYWEIITSEVKILLLRCVHNQPSQTLTRIHIEPSSGEDLCAHNYDAVWFPCLWERYNIEQECHPNQAQY